MLNMNYGRKDRRRDHNRLKRAVVDAEQREEARPRLWLELASKLLDSDAPEVEDGRGIWNQKRRAA